MPVPDPRCLLGHAPFVEALARRLARDDDRAADAVQRTWLAVLRGPGRPISERGRLTVLVRNSWRARGRASRDRRQGS